MTTNATVQGDYDFNGRNRAEKEERLIVSQWRELSQKHGDHGRPFAVTFVRTPDGTVSAFGGYPAGRVKE